MEEYVFEVDLFVRALQGSLDKELGMSTYILETLGDFRYAWKHLCVDLYGSNWKCQDLFIDNHIEVVTFCKQLEFCSRVGTSAVPVTVNEYEPLIDNLILACNALIEEIKERK